MYCGKALTETIQTSHWDENLILVQKSLGDILRSEASMKLLRPLTAIGMVTTLTNTHRNAPQARSGQHNGDGKSSLVKLVASVRCWMLLIDPLQN
eukprot:6182936-Pleurochrysis_carterae.AAC.1